MTENEIGKIVVDSAINVHKVLGPGLLESAYEAQLLSYLKLSECKLGFLLNFNVYRMKDGIRRMVNGL